MKAQTHTQSQTQPIEGRWHCKIDYVTLSCAALHIPQDDTEEYHLSANEEASWSMQRIGVFSLPFMDLSRWRQGGGRSGHKRSAYHDIGVTIFYGHPFNKPIVEMGGAACDVLAANDELMPLIHCHYEDLTRLDLAADLTCETTPASFLSHGLSGRYVSNGHANSATGQTEYIGSSKSDRSVKVYRYAPPHPRSDALRVEVTLRRELAKAAGQELLSRRVADVYAAACQPFAFKSPQWRLPTDDRLPRLTMKSEPTSASRLRWLTTKIFPSVVQAHRDGLIDLATWLAEATKA